jgi:hypothetical protein
MTISQFLRVKKITIISENYGGGESEFTVTLFGSLDKVKKDKTK